ncbi:hypothetical protein NDA03_22195 [Trichocoleus sp. Lan]|uniref:hypothetical protein n=1 Tax=Trichocoleus sp. Lan TaxID=2933927 RepID=UPI0032991CF0
MKYLRLTITDTLSFWDDYLSGYIPALASSQTFTNWYRVPDEWLENSTLISSRREQLLAHLYGDNWLFGNEDGSKYVVLAISEHELSDAERAQRLWSGTKDTCYAVSDDGTIERVSQDAM